MGKIDLGLFRGVGASTYLGANLSPPLHLFKVGLPKGEGPRPFIEKNRLIFFLPNHAMHPDLLQRASSMKGELVAASQTGDGCRWVAVRLFQMFFS